MENVKIHLLLFRPKLLVENSMCKKYSLALNN